MTDQTLTKEQILEHALGVNLFLARNGDLVRIDAYDKLENIDYPLAVLNFTNEDSDRYFVADNGRFYTGKESPKDIVSLVTADNLKQLFSQPQHSAPAPKPDIDFEQCIKDSTFLKTRDGSKVLLTRRNDTPNTTYPYAGVVIRGRRASKMNILEIYQNNPNTVFISRDGSRYKVKKVDADADDDDYPFLMEKITENDLGERKNWVANNGRSDKYCPKEDPDDIVDYERPLNISEIY